MNDSELSIKTRLGLTTFLDVLGWKGIYHRLQEPLGKLLSLVNAISQDAKSFGTGSGRITLVKSISDTIAIFTALDEERSLEKAIELHGQLCARAIANSIRAELPLRGATSYGEFQVAENIFVGKAVDEASEWHEKADWIGVHLTPSAAFIFQGKSTRFWFEYQPPLKELEIGKAPCVNWREAWQEMGEDQETLKQYFINMGPIVPEISGKFINTLNFYQSLPDKVPLRNDSVRNKIKEET